MNTKARNPYYILGGAIGVVAMAAALWACGKPSGDGDWTTIPVTGNAVFRSECTLAGPGEAYSRPLTLWKKEGDLPLDTIELAQDLPELAVKYDCTKRLLTFRYSGRESAWLVPSNGHVD